MNSEGLIPVEKGNLEKLKESLDQVEVNVNAKDAKGDTVLLRSVSSNQHEMVARLMQSGADVFQTDDEGNTALHIAIRNSIKAVIDAILENVARDKLRKLLDTKIKSSGNAALHIAAEKGCYDDASLLLRYGANFEIRNEDGKKPVDFTNKDDVRKLLELIDASFAKAENGCELLISDLEKCDYAELTTVMNCRNNEGRTIMQVTLANNNDKLSRALLQLRTVVPIPECDFERSRGDDGIDKREKLAERIEKYQVTWSRHAGALVMLAMHNRFQLRFPVDIATFVENIMKMSCETMERAQEVFLEYRNWSGGRSLTASTAMKTLEELFEFVGFDADQTFVAEEASCYKKSAFEWINNYKVSMHLIEGIVQTSIAHFSQSFNKTRLIQAINDEDVDKVQHLLETTPGPELANHRSNCGTVLQQAAERGNEKIIQLLLKAGAKVAQENEVSLLYSAVDKGDANIVQLLLKEADINDVAMFIDCQQQVERTALHAAAERARLDIVKMLLSFGATYCIADGQARTPLDVSTSEEVSDFLNLVDQCFCGANNADNRLIYKLKAMQTVDFIAIANARDLEGHTLAVVAAKAGAKKITGFVLKLIVEAKRKNKQ